MKENKDKGKEQNNITCPYYNEVVKHSNCSLCKNEQLCTKIRRRMKIVKFYEEHNKFKRMVRAIGTFTIQDITVKKETRETVLSLVKEEFIDDNNYPEIKRGIPTQNILKLDLGGLKLNEKAPKKKRVKHPRKPKKTPKKPWKNDDFFKKDKVSRIKGTRKSTLSAEALRIIESGAEIVTLTI